VEGTAVIQIVTGRLPDGGSVHCEIVLNVKEGKVGKRPDDEEFANAASVLVDDHIVSVLAAVFTAPDIDKLLGTMESYSATGSFASNGITVGYKADFYTRLGRKVVFGTLARALDLLQDLPTMLGYNDKLDKLARIAVGVVVEAATIPPADGEPKVRRTSVVRQRYGGGIR